MKRSKRKLGLATQQVQEVALHLLSSNPSSPEFDTARKKAAKMLLQLSHENQGLKLKSFLGEL